MTINVTHNRYSHTQSKFPIIVKPVWDKGDDEYDDILSAQKTTIQATIHQLCKHYVKIHSLLNKYTSNYHHLLPLRPVCT